jgi:hypothetical protein
MPELEKANWSKVSEDDATGVSGEMGKAIEGLVVLGKAIVTSFSGYDAAGDCREMVIEGLGGLVVLDEAASTGFWEDDTTGE